MLLFLTLTGVFLSGLLLYFNGKKFHSSMYLGLFYLLSSIHGLVRYIAFYSGSSWLVSASYVHFSFLDYLIGPLLYFYVRSLLNDQSGLKPRDYWHFVPSALYLAFIFPYFFAPWAEKMAYAVQIVADPDKVALLEPTAVHRFLSTRIVFLSRLIWVSGYVFLSASSLIRFMWRRRELAVFTHQRFMLKWLMALLGFSLVLAISQSLLIFETYLLRRPVFFFTLNSLELFSGAGMIGLLVSPFFFPSILYGLPRMPAAPEKEESNYQQEFETGYLESVGRKADACMAEFQPYLKPDFSMAHLAVLIQAPVHHLAYYFREEKKQPFTEYRNTWRVQHAKELIRQGKTRELTLEAIGLLCGFSSRSAFHAAFKKAEGISPGEYAARFSFRSVHD
jgi:AraC-like DNA-binding protein